MKVSSLIFAIALQHRFFPTSAEVHLSPPVRALIAEKDQRVSATLTMIDFISEEIEDLRCIGISYVSKNERFS